MDTATVSQESFEVIDVPVSAITVNRSDRIRSELPDIAEFAEEIRQSGLLQPIGITPGLDLVFGERRLEAYRHLGWDMIPCRILHDTETQSVRIGMEIRENVERKNFRLKDQLRAARMLLPSIKEFTESRRNSGRPGGDLPSDQPEGHPWLAVRHGEEWREALARIVGAGRDRLQHALKITDEAHGDPEIAMIAARMLDDENVNAAWDAYCAVMDDRTPPRAETPAPAANAATVHSGELGAVAADPEVAGLMGKSDSRRTAERPAKKTKGKNGATATAEAPPASPGPDEPADHADTDPTAPQLKPKAEGDLEIYSCRDYVEFCDNLLHKLPKPQQARVAAHYREIYAPETPVTPEQADAPSPAPQVKTAADVANRLRDMIDGLPKKEHRDAIAASAAVLAEMGKKPAHYLPRLPDAHEDAVTQIKDEIAARVSALNQFSGWDQNGRPQSVRALIKAMHAKATEVKKICGIESLDDVKQPEIFDTKWPEHLDTPAVKAVWDIWTANRRKRKLPIDAAVMQKQIRNLSILDAEQAIEVITGAHENNWQGIREDVCNKSWCGRPPAGPGTASRPSEKTKKEQAKAELEARKEQLERRMFEEAAKVTPKLIDCSKNAHTEEAALRASCVAFEHVRSLLALPSEMQGKLNSHLMRIAERAFAETHPPKK